MSDKFSVVIANWSIDNETIQAIRTEVFIQEQSVPVALEWDGLDDQATHLLVFTYNHKAVATLRLLDDGHIGRVAVLKPFRRLGIATAMMQTALKILQQRHISNISLDSQQEVIPFYQKLGFQTIGSVFMDAGIPHIKMRKQLQTENLR
jgi:predicted GNAT family N-acyltransferase